MGPFSQIIKIYCAPFTPRILYNLDAVGIEPTPLDFKLQQCHIYIFGDISIPKYYSSKVFSIPSKAAMNVRKYSENPEISAVHIPL